jgi:hypothetical protein
MSAAFAVAAAVALIAIVTLALTARRAAAERSRAEQLRDQLRAAVDARAETEARLQHNQEALAEAEQRDQENQAALAQAESRLRQQEEDALAGAAQPLPHDEGAGPPSVEAAGEAGAAPLAEEGDRRAAVAGALWELERFRLEREWAELSGTPTPLPEPWDGGIHAAMAVELEIIREVIGVPTRLDPAGAPPMDPLTALGAARLTAEVLRGVARVGEEIVVSFEPDGEVVANIATDGEGTAPDLGRLRTVAEQLGGDLVVLPTDDGLQARLRLPARPA